MGYFVVPTNICRPIQIFTLIQVKLTLKQCHLIAHSIHLQLNCSVLQSRIIWGWGSQPASRDVFCTARVLSL
jgi:hypothetical protein